MASLAVALRLPYLYLFRRPFSTTKSQRCRNNNHASSKHKKHEDCDHEHDHHEPYDPSRLLTYNEIPDWYRQQESPFVTTGYRPPSHSCQSSLQSLLHLHNETLNVYTHLVPALVLAVVLPWLQHHMTIAHPTHSPLLLDRLMLALTPTAAVTTFALSSCYHTLANHSPIVSATSLLLDFAGILLLIGASFASGIYVGFYGHPFEQRLYWSLITTLVCASGILIFHPKFHGMAYRPHRTAAFVCTVLSGLGPAGHGMYTHGVRRGFHECGVKWWCVEGLWYALGVTFFVSRYPERWAYAKEREVRQQEQGQMREREQKREKQCGSGSANASKHENGARERAAGDGLGQSSTAKSKNRWTGRFDIFGASHQLFHVCVVLGAACHCWGVWEAWTYAVGARTLT